MKAVYVSSKLRHADMWKQARDVFGWDITSTWIDGEKLEKPEELGRMWDRYFDEIAVSDMLILYVEPELILKGALIEVGAALMFDKEVVVIFTEGDMDKLQEIVGTWIHQPKVTVVKDIEDVSVR